MSPLREPLAVRLQFRGLRRDLPRFALEAAYNCLSTNLETMRKGALRNVSLRIFISNNLGYLWSNLVIPTLNSRMPIASAVSSLCIPVVGIVGGCSNPEMRWVATSRIVTSGAVMKNPKPLRDWAFVNKPRSGASMNHFRRASTTANHSVALCFGASPNPTFSDLLNFWPESLKKSFGKPLCGENRVGVKWNWNAPSFSLAWLRRVCDRGAHSVRFAAHGLLGKSVV